MWLTWIAPDNSLVAKRRLRFAGNGLMRCPCASKRPSVAALQMNALRNCLAKRLAGMGTDATGIHSPIYGRLLRIQLDDQVLVDVARQVATVWQGLEHARELLGIHLDPARAQIHALGERHGFLHAQ